MTPDIQDTTHKTRSTPPPDNNKKNNKRKKKPTGLQLYGLRRGFRFESPEGYEITRYLPRIAGEIIYRIAMEVMQRDVERDVEI